MIKKLSFYFAFSVLITACNQKSKLEIKQEVQVNIRKNNSGFTDFLTNFQLLSYGEVLNTTCLDIEGNRRYKKLNTSKHKSFLNGYEGPAVSIGYFSDTTNFFVLIYCTASACYLPNLSVYNKNGELIQTCLLASGCGSDVGYECSETVQLISLDKIITTKLEKYYETDSLGEKLESSLNQLKTKILYSIDLNGQIKLDTLK